MLRAVGSAGLLDDVSVLAPVRTCTGGHSKSGGNAGAPGTADALALPPGMVPASFASDPKESGNEDAEQPASTGLSRANAIARAPAGKPSSDKPTHRTPRQTHSRLRSGMANSW